MCNSVKHNSRKRRESLSKRLGRTARRIRARDDHRCVYCGATEQSSGAPLHLDHLTPKRLGGEDEATNIVVACRSCNSRRQDRKLADWARDAHELTFTSRSIRARARRVLPKVP